MAYSTQRVVSDGTLTLLALSISYIDRAEISVYFAGVLTPSSSGLWAWVGSTGNSIAFTPAVANGVEVKIVRATDLTQMRHDFSGGAQFLAQTIDENFDQILHIAQEAREGATLAEVFNDLDMHSNYIHNVASGIMPSDAVNVGQIVGLTSGQVALAQAAATSAAASYDSFDDRYLGAKTSAPSLDNDGNPLIVGALYWDSTMSALGVRTGGGTWSYSLSNSASAVSNTPSGGISATNVQAAINELDTEKATVTALAAKQDALGYTPVQQYDSTVLRLRYAGSYVGLYAAGTYVGDLARPAYANTWSVDQSFTAKIRILPGCSLFFLDGTGNGKYVQMDGNTLNVYDNAGAGPLFSIDNSGNVYVKGTLSAADVTIR